jgi:hypothetical protein
LGSSKLGRIHLVYQQPCSCDERRLRPPLRFRLVLVDSEKTHSSKDLSTIDETSVPDHFTS